PELWYSSDGATWQLAHTLESDTLHFDAGEEGFVGVGWIGEAREPYAIATADGREWIEASSPPTDPGDVAPLGGDWIAMSAFTEDGTDGETSFSADGLDWNEHGGAELSTVRADGAPCTEYPRDLVPAGRWVVVNTALQYPCTEGGFVVYGTQQISVDGVTWAPLPFEPGTPGETRSGASVNTAIAVDGGLVLAGEEDGQATFWFGESR
ncbi:MAG: hypothetical protein ABR593_05185, partial [Candidatus Limnocylindria bacterium]